MLTIERIGDAAGEVWQFLRANGPASLTAIERAVEAPRGVVGMAVGWLAREGKLEIREEKRVTMLALRQG